jgi:hypothetical protein
MTKLNQPSWLTKHQLEEAESLIAIGFCYVGDVSQHYDEEEIEFNKFIVIGNWKFCTVQGEPLIDAICEGALYSWCLEIHPEKDKPNFFNDRVNEIQLALKNVYYSDSDSKQLSLF